MTLHLRFLPHLYKSNNSTIRKKIKVKSESTRATSRRRKKRGGKKSNCTEEVSNEKSKFRRLLITRKSISGFALSYVNLLSSSNFNFLTLKKTQMPVISITEVTTETMTVISIVWFFFPAIFKKFCLIKILLGNQNWIKFRNIKRASLRGTHWVVVPVLLDQGSPVVLQSKA